MTEEQQQSVEQTKYRTHEHAECNECDVSMIIDNGETYCPECGYVPSKQEALERRSLQYGPTSVTERWEQQKEHAATHGRVRVAGGFVGEFGDTKIEWHSGTWYYDDIEG